MNLKRSTLTALSIAALSTCLFAGSHAPATGDKKNEQKKPEAAPAPVTQPTPEAITDAHEMEALSQIIIDFQDADTKLAQADAQARLSVAVPLIIQRQKKGALDEAIAAAQKKHHATGCQLDFKLKTWTNCPAPAAPAAAAPATTPAPATPPLVTVPTTAPATPTQPSNEAK